MAPVGIFTTIHFLYQLLADEVEEQASKAKIANDKLKKAEEKTAKLKKALLNKKQRKALKKAEEKQKTAKAKKQMNQKKVLKKAEALKQKKAKPKKQKNQKKVRPDPIGEVDVPALRRAQQSILASSYVADAERAERAQMFKKAEALKQKKAEALKQKKALKQKPAGWQKKAKPAGWPSKHLATK